MVMAASTIDEPNSTVVHVLNHRSVGWVPCGGTYPPGFKSSTWHGCLYFSGFILGFNGATLSLVGDVLIDSEAPVVTSCLSQDLPA